MILGVSAVWIGVALMIPRIWDSLKGALESTAFLTLAAIIVLNPLSGVLAMSIDQYVLVYFMNHGNSLFLAGAAPALTAISALIALNSIPLMPAVLLTPAVSSKNGAAR